jgi:hypothetical protein
MADNEQKQYPRGQVSFGAGDLIQCINAKFTFVNGAKVQSTLRRNPSGVILGNKSVTANFDCKVDEDGPERDWVGLVNSGKPQQARFKFPGGKTYTLNVTVSQLDAASSMEDGCDHNVTLVGALVKA